MVGKATVFMGFMLVFGSANTIFTKLMFQLGFSHAYFQTTGLFLGDACNMFLYLLIRNRIEHRPVKQPACPSSFHKLIVRLNKYSFSISGTFAVIGNLGNSLGLLLSAASIYQMIRGFVIVIVAGYTLVFLRRPLFRHQYIGCSLVILGVIAVGVSSILAQQSSAPNPVLGAIIITISQFFQAGQFVTEESILCIVEVDPSLAVGMEGITGTLLFAVLILPVLYAIPCNASDICSNGRVENSISALNTIGTNWILLVLFLGVIVSLGIFNYAGMTTTKLTSSLARSLIDTARTLVVWVFSLAVGWEVITPFTALQFFGFILLVTGTLIYNQAIVVDFLGIRASVEAYNEYMKRDEYADKFLITIDSPNSQSRGSSEVR